MRLKSWKTWAGVAGVLVLVVVCGGFAWADWQLRRFAGEFTQVVDRVAFARPPQRIAIVHVDVLAPDGTTMLPDRTVLVDEGRIVSVSAAGTEPSAARRIDGHGRYLVPGFVDTHVHLRHSPNDLLLFLANGVTSIAEMSGSESHLAWRRATEAGAAGPRMFIASGKLGNWGVLDGWFKAWTRHRINVGSPGNAREVIEELKSEGELPYANPGQVAGTPLSRGWLPGNNPYGLDPTLSAEDREDERRYWTTYAEAHHILLRALLDAGVHVMAGTDTGNAVVVPGFSLHDEMGALVRAGASNTQTLRAATATPGEWLGNDTGRIVPGARADLVLLDADPLQDIANTRRIDAVILGGRLFDRSALDRMLAAVETANHP